MAHRCPGALLRGSGSIPGFRFRINLHGVATIVPSKATVYGVLWDLIAEHEARLDDYEGVSLGLYGKKQISVQLPGGATIQALVYVAANSQLGQPFPGYLELIIAAAKEHALPAAYVTELERWQEFQPDDEVATSGWNVRV